MTEEKKLSLNIQKEVCPFTNKQPLIENDVSNEKQTDSTKILERKSSIFKLDQYKFYMGFSWFSRQFYLNYTKILFLIRKNVISKNKMVQLENIPSLEDEQRVESVLKLYEHYLNGLGKQESITASDIYNMIKASFRLDFLAVHLFIILEMVCKVFNSVVIQQIITQFQEDYNNQSSTYTMTIIYTLILFVLVFLALNFRNKYQFLLESQSTQARQGLMILLYKKVGSMTQYQISKANIADLGQIEIFMQFYFIAIWTPFLIIGTTIVLCLRLGAFGLLGIAAILIIYPNQQIFGKLQHKYFALKSISSDERIKLINESIEGIRLIKMYGWENIIGKQIYNIREKEQNSIIKAILIRASDRAFSNSLILIAAFIPIIAVHYSETDIQLDSAKIFATLESINGLKFMIFMSGAGVQFIYQWKEISKRFASFIGLKKQFTQQVVKNPKYNENISQLQSEISKKQTNKEKVTLEEEEIVQIQPFIEINNQKVNDENEYMKTLNQKNSIEFSEDFECFWEKNERKQEPCLKFSKSLNFENGKFYGIIGKIGSGKSSLFQILIQEMPFYQGEIRVSGSMAYVEQEPYIFSGKFRDNILFGKNMKHNFYQYVIESCCLKDDIDSFLNGDLTEIGERGITLSGGQKARLSLARAVYSESDIYLLDDPLSAVDAKVAKSLHNLCLMGLLKGKTIILVTHQTNFIRNCDEILILEDGRLSAKGSFDELKEKILSIENNITNDQNEINVIENDVEKVQNELKLQDHEEDLDVNREDDDECNKQLEKSSTQQDKKQITLFSKDEDEQVKVTFSTLNRYLKSSKSCYLVYFGLLMFASSDVLFTFFYRIFGSYDNQKEASDFNDLFKNSGIILLFYVLANVLKYFSITAIVYNSSKEMHRKMFEHLCRAPISYFDTNPSGRIVNKFSNDFFTLDFVMFFNITDTTDNIFSFANLILTVAIYNYWFFILAVFFGFALYMWGFYCKKLIIQSQSLDRIHKGPVISFFSKTIQGIVNLRVYRQVNNFLDEFSSLCNDSIRTNHWYYQLSRSFNFNSQVLASIVTFFGILITVYTTSNKQDLGQTIVYLTLIIEQGNFMIRQLISIDGSLTSAERVFRICDIQHEGPLKLKSDESLIKKDQDQIKLHQKKIQKKNNMDLIKWVSKGSVEFKNVYMKYRQELDFTLKGVNFKIESGQHVGCIGRTGAGKSSLLQVLFRMVDIENSGQILLDSVDINTIGLNTLRANISIIPQTSFIFSGTIRKNIDPLGEFKDEEVIKALTLTGLIDVVNSLEKKLDTDMTNASSVFSVGQKQLICLARAVLSNSKLLVLDEATANLDIQTDVFIQKTIKEVFKNSTIFTIAHRLNTIADYDKVLVMNDGCVAEYDSPFKLLVNEISDTQITSNSIFAQMVQHTGKSNSQIIFQIAQKKYFYNQQQS